jgi:hypothetical protein
MVLLLRCGRGEAAAQTMPDIAGQDFQDGMV